MNSTWLCLIALVGFVQGATRFRRQYYYSPELNHDGNGGHLPTVSLTRIPQTSTAICRLVSSSGHQVSGDVVFRQNAAEQPVEITGVISGLSPGYHGFHVHQNANLTDNCKAAGPHFNPAMQTHGAPYDSVRHAGDLGNIIADENGISNFQILDAHVTLFANHPNQILGRAIVVHEKEDDLGRGVGDESKKTGNAGARLACCVIEPLHGY